MASYRLKELRVEAGQYWTHDFLLEEVPEYLQVTNEKSGFEGVLQTTSPMMIHGKETRALEPHNLTPAEIEDKWVQAIAWWGRDLVRGQRG